RVGRPARFLVELCLVIKASEQEPSDISGVATTNPNAPGVRVDQFTSALSRLHNAEYTHEPQHPRGQQGRLRPASAHEDKSEALTERNGEENVARPFAPRLVLAHGHSNTGHIFHRYMGVVSRPRCRHSRSRPQENEGSGRWPREERPAAKGNPAEQHPNHHQANSEVDNEGMVEADIWHIVLSSWFPGVNRPPRPPRPSPRDRRHRTRRRRKKTAPPVVAECERGSRVPA